MSLNLETPQAALSRCWDSEELFTDGDVFFAAVIERIRTAQRSVKLESYIFNDDELGRLVINELCDAAGRGVSVRVIVDGIGSPLWERRFGPELRRAGVDYRIFHRIPFLQDRTRPRGRSEPSLLVRLRRLNRRNHRKLIIVDDAIAWAGSMNISAVHSRKLSGDSVWRDTGIMVSGSDVSVLSAGFDHAFAPIGRRLKRKRALLRYSSELARLNSTRTLRRRNYRDLLLRLSRARERIWITTPYFVPTGEVLDVLEEAASRGVDVRLLVPSKSDVFFMPWVAAAFVYGLLRGGAQVFEYLPSVLHSKTILIDDWGTVGSSNLNHRSIFHDLEVDIVISRAESIAKLSELYLEDLQQSRQVTLSVWSARSWITRIMGRLLLLFRDWL